MAALPPDTAAPSRLQAASTAGSRWLQERHPIHDGPATLTSNRIYIVPTGAGLGFFGLLGVLMLWSINYSNNMGFGLVFLLVGVLGNVMWRTRDNLLKLKVFPGYAAPVFAGQLAQFHYPLQAPTARYGVGGQWQQQAIQAVDMPADAMQPLPVGVLTTRRGYCRPGHVCLSTRYPLGLFVAWSYVAFESGVWVYPKPLGQRPLPIDTPVLSWRGKATGTVGSDDFAGLRGYRPGDPPRHIAWKSAARSSALPVKEFASPTRPELWLDYQAIDGPPELRLSQLCRWVLDADQRNLRYGLRLPTATLAPDQGDSHRRRCLDALARFTS